MSNKNFGEIESLSNEVSELWNEITEEIYSLDEIEDFLTNFNLSNYLKNSIYELGLTGEREYFGIEAAVVPNKNNIRDLLSIRKFMYGNLSYECKEIIINSLIETLDKPHQSPCSQRIIDGKKISEHLLDLIKMHPKTPDELKAQIELLTN